MAYPVSPADVVSVTVETQDGRAFDITGLTSDAAIDYLLLSGVERLRDIVCTVHRFHGLVVNESEEE